MSHPPILPFHQACPSPADREHAAQLAEALLSQQPRLSTPGELARYRASSLEDAPALHIDDFSDITLPEAYGSIEFLEDRARLRAGDGDLLVTRIEPALGYEEYCRSHLGLGSVRWLRANAPDPRRSLAAACWIDPKLRTALRRADFRYIHPHMGSFAVWALADLLSRTSGRFIEVIAPPPRLTRATNDKLWVADVVSRLLGSETIPKTHAASNVSTMAAVVRDLSADSKRLVIKLTDSVGGGGNLVIDSARFRNLPLGQIRLRLKSLLRRLDWRGEASLLVGCWETDVLSAPSAQIWIPPLEVGEPCTEGIFEQVIEGREGFFVGSRPARFASDLTQAIVDACWLTARVFQRLGYVGRCSFDLILVGSSLSSCKLEFVECNARWGGTSLPMTLMGRLFGRRREQLYACLECPLDTGHTKGLPPSKSWRSFTDLLSCLGDHLYDRRTGQGDLVLYNPGALTQAEISVVGLGRGYYDDPRYLDDHVRGLCNTTSAGRLTA